MIKLAHPQIDDDDRQAVLAALDSGQLAQGPRVAAFEQAFAAYVGTKHAVALNSGTAALHLALLANRIGDRRSFHASDLRPPTSDTPDAPSDLRPPTSDTPGEPSGLRPPISDPPDAPSDLRPPTSDTPDEVVVPAFSFAATPNVVLQAGARPVFVDVREEDFGIDPAQVEAAITPRTRAVIAVHLYGQVCDIAAIATICDNHGIALIEDAAQAVGATLEGRRAGTWGTGCFSLYATKNLQTGEGGMITTDDDAVASAARVLRSQGEPQRYVTDILGYNYRMTEIAAALGASQLAKLDARTDNRRAHAARLSGLLAANRNLVVPRELPGRRHVWHQYTVRVKAGAEARARLLAGLRDRGIESATFYPTPIHRQPLYRRLGYGDLDLPIAQRLADEALSLPIHPALSDADIDTVAAAVNEITTLWE